MLKWLYINNGAYAGAPAFSKSTALLASTGCARELAVSTPVAVENRHQFANEALVERNLLLVQQACSQARRSDFTSGTTSSIRGRRAGTGLYLNE